MIQFKNVNLSFQDKSILSNFDLTITEGDKILVVGKSGIGKTTLINLIQGFIRPDSGTVNFNNNPIDAKYVWDIRKKIAYIPQEVTFTDMNVKELIDMCQSLKSKHQPFYDPKRLTDYLHHFELEEDILTKDCKSISGGEKQRIVIIIALLLDRKIFLMDEPTASLDAGLKKKVVSFFSNLKDCTLLCISHDEAWKNLSNAKIFDMEKLVWMS